MSWDCPTTCVNRLKRSETGLLLDGQRVFTNAVVRAGQVLEANLGEAERPSRITPIAMDLHILFEDEHLLVLDKPAPLAVIPSSLSPGEQPWPTAWPTIWVRASPSIR